MQKDVATVENSVDGPREVKKRGSMGGAVVWCLSLALGAILETRDGIPLWAPGHGACFSLCLCLCLSLCDYHKKILKKKLKIELPYDSKISQLGIYPEDREIL